MAAAVLKLETCLLHLFTLKSICSGPKVGPAYLNLNNGVSWEAIGDGPEDPPDHPSRRGLVVAAAV